MPAQKNFLNPFSINGMEILCKTLADFVHEGMTARPA
jgi:hypothetical protein